MRSRAVLSAMTGGMPSGEYHAVAPHNRRSLPVVTPGHGLLDPRRVHRGTTEFVEVTSSGTPVAGSVFVRVSEVLQDGVEGLLIVHTSQDGSDQRLRSVLLERMSLRPLWTRAHDDQAAWTTQYDWLRGRAAHMPHSGPLNVRAHKFPAPPFDALSLPWVVTALPLSEELKVRLPVFDAQVQEFEWRDLVCLGRLRRGSSRSTGTLRLELRGPVSTTELQISSRQRHVKRITEARTGPDGSTVERCWQRVRLLDG